MSLMFKAMITDFFSFNVTVLYIVDGDTDGTHKGKRYMYTPSDLGKFFKLIDLTSVLDPKVNKFCDQTMYQISRNVLMTVWFSTLFKEKDMLF